MRDGKRRRKEEARGWLQFRPLSPWILCTSLGVRGRLEEWLKNLKHSLISVVGQRLRHVLLQTRPILKEPQVLKASCFTSGVQQPGTNKKISRNGHRNDRNG